MFVVGLTGYPLSGKDTVAEYFVEKGFVLLSGGNMIREAMRNEGLPADRENIQAYVRKMRVQHGDAYLVELMLPLINGGTVISAFREIAGVELMKKTFSEEFVLLNVSAPIDVRYNRAQLRQREGDKISIEDFKRLEDIECNSEGYSMDHVVAAADMTIQNNGTKKELYFQLDQLFKKSLHV
jgi:dephospho-CoA kinase